MVTAIYGREIEYAMLEVIMYWRQDSTGRRIKNVVQTTTLAL